MQAQFGALFEYEIYASESSTVPNFDFDVVENATTINIVIEVYR